MPTTTATLTLNTSEFSGGGTLTKAATLTKAGTATGIDQFTGVSRVYKAAATNDISVVANGDYTDDKAHKVYISKWQQFQHH